MGSHVLQRRFPYEFFIGVLLIVLSCVLLFAHVQSLAIKKSTALTVGAALPALRTQVVLLKATVEAEKVTGADTLAALEEQAVATVFPEDESTARFARTIPVLLSAIDGGRNSLAFSRLQFADSPVSAGSHKERSATVILRGSLHDVSRFLSLFQYQDKLTVGDVLGPKASADFLRQVEVQSPASLTTASAFLQMDSIRYSLDPQAAEKNVLQDMDTATAADIHAFLLSAGLSSVRSTLSPVANMLRQERVWPLPLTRIESVSEQDGVWTLRFSLLTRQKSATIRS